MQVAQRAPPFSMYKNNPLNFFGRMKNEMFYGRSWDGVPLDTLIKRVHEYMQWYREERIKMSLGGLSPAEFRRAHGFT